MKIQKQASESLYVFAMDLYNFVQNIMIRKLPK